MIAHPTVTSHIGPPRSDAGKPWRLGQWATYRRQTGGKIQIEKLTVVAVDGCGVWIEELTDDYDHHGQFLFCFEVAGGMPSDPTEALGRLQVAIIRWDYEPPTVLDFHDSSAATLKSQFADMISWLFLSTTRRQPGLAPEDVDVPAGHFPAANRDRYLAPDGTSDLMRWFHDDIPFDGTVKAVDSRSGLHIDLLGYGCCQSNSPVERMAERFAYAATPRPPPRWFVDFGGSYGWSSSHGADTDSPGSGFLFTSSIRVTPMVDLRILIRDETRDRYAPDPMLTEHAGFALLGVRYHPFGPVRARLPALAGLSGLYVQGAAGYAELDLLSDATSTTAGRGFVAGAGLGWIGMHAQDWAMGFELTDHVAFYNHGAGTRNTFSLGAFLELYLPTPFGPH